MEQCESTGKTVYYVIHVHVCDLVHMRNTNNRYSLIKLLQLLYHSSKTPQETFNIGKSPLDPLLPLMQTKVKSCQDKPDEIIQVIFPDIKN